MHRDCPNCSANSIPISELILGDSRCQNCKAQVRVNKIAAVVFSILIIFVTIATSLMVLSLFGIYAVILWFAFPIGAIGYVKARFCPLAARQAASITGGNETMHKVILIALTVSTCLPAVAGDAHVLDVAISCTGNLVCDFDVTVKHTDDGWDHFANKWEVVSPDGKILATRELAHPHVDEQPFVRSLTKVRIPGNLDEVLIRAHDSRHQYGGKEITVKLPK